MKFITRILEIWAAVAIIYFSILISVQMIYFVLWSRKLFSSKLFRKGEKQSSRSVCCSRKGINTRVGGGLRTAALFLFLSSGWRIWIQNRPPVWTLISPPDEDEESGVIDHLCRCELELKSIQFLNKQTNNVTSTSSPSCWGGQTPSILIHRQFLKLLIQFRVTRWMNPPAERSLIQFGFYVYMFCSSGTEWPSL